VQIQSQDRSGESLVVLKEGDRGYIVTVHKGRFPAHYSKEFDNYEGALSDFNRLARFETYMIMEVTDRVNDQLDPGVTFEEVMLCLLDAPRGTATVEAVVKWISKEAYT